MNLIDFDYIYIYIYIFILKMLKDRNMQANMIVFFFLRMQENTIFTKDYIELKSNKHFTFWIVLILCYFTLDLRFLTSL